MPVGLDSSNASETPAAVQGGKTALFTRGGCGHARAMAEKTRQPARRIAMWSGPRNISTAMMRAFENRPDTSVVDEPFYACYLARTGRIHPGRDAVLAAQPTDWRDVVRGLRDTAGNGTSIVYEKHMTHHIDDDIALDWLDEALHCFLIRAPRNMLASLLRVLPDAGLDDTGLPQQLRLYDAVCDKTGAPPPVVDSADVLRDPRAMLSALCDTIGIGFVDSMLSWPAGPRDSDGVWAPHWYASVWRSTGFAAYRPASPDIPEDKLEVLAQCERLYARLYQNRLRA